MTICRLSYPKANFQNTLHPQRHCRPGHLPQKKPKICVVKSVIYQGRLHFQSRHGCPQREALPLLAREQVVRTPYTRKRGLLMMESPAHLCKSDLRSRKRLKKKNKHAGYMFLTQTGFSFFILLCLSRI